MNKTHFPLLLTMAVLLLVVAIVSPFTFNAANTTDLLASVSASVTLRPGVKQVTFASDGTELINVTQTGSNGGTAQVLKGRDTSWVVAPSNAKWISYSSLTYLKNKGPDKGVTMWFSKSFVIKGAPLDGQITVAADDTATVMVNGHAVFDVTATSYTRCADRGVTCTKYNIKKIPKEFLVTGKNILTFGLLQGTKGTPYGLLYWGYVYDDQNISSGGGSGGGTCVTGKNAAFGNPTYLPGTNNVKVASFTICGEPTQGWRLGSLTFDKDNNPNIDLKNMKVMVGAIQFGATKTSVADGEAAINFSSNNPITVPQGGSITVDVYADIDAASVASTYASVIDWIGWSALGTVSNSAVIFPGPFDGQDVTLTSGGGGGGGGSTSCSGSSGGTVLPPTPGPVGPTLTLAADSNTPGAKYVVMGSTGNALLAFRLAANSIEDVKVTNITVTDIIGNGVTGIAPFHNLTLWNGATQVAGPLNLTMPTSVQGTASFSLNPVLVPKNGNVTLTLKGSAIDFGSASGSDGFVNTFCVDANGFTAVGAISNSGATVSGSATGNAITVYRSNIGISATTVGATTNRAKSSNDYLANLTFTVPSGATAATVQKVKLTFSGSAVAGTFQVYLLNGSGAPLGSSSASKSCVTANNACSVTFDPLVVVDNTAPLVAQVKAVSSGFADTANTADPLAITIAVAGDVIFNDGTTSNIPLDPVIAIPFTVASVSYP